ncbi:uncharacterized protein LOC144168378, partial [Haemaphysalis longicornis]
TGAPSSAAVLSAPAVISSSAGAGNSTNACISRCASSCFSGAAASVGTFSSVWGSSSPPAGAGVSTTAVLSEDGGLSSAVSAASLTALGSIPGAVCPSPCAGTSSTALTSDSTWPSTVVLTYTCTASSSSPALVSFGGSSDLINVSCVPPISSGFVSLIESACSGDLLSLASPALVAIAFVVSSRTGIFASPSASSSSFPKRSPVKRGVSASGYSERRTDRSSVNISTKGNESPSLLSSSGLPAVLGIFV